MTRAQRIFLIFYSLFWVVSLAVFVFLHFKTDGFQKKITVNFAGLPGFLSFMSASSTPTSHSFPILTKKPDEFLPIYDLEEKYRIFFPRNITTGTEGLRPGQDALKEVDSGFVFSRSQQKIPYMWVGVMNKDLEKIRQSLKTENIQETKIALSKEEVKALTFLPLKEQPSLKEWLIPFKEGKSLAFMIDTGILNEDTIATIFKRLEIEK